MMASVTLYSKPGCHLCEVALEALMRVQQQQSFALEEVNIESDPALMAEYGEQIPVVTLNGVFLFQYTVEEARLRQALAEAH